MIDHLGVTLKLGARTSAARIVEAAGEKRIFRQGDAMYLPRTYRYRHIIDSTASGSDR